MAKMMELAIAIKGKLDASLPASFKTASASTSELTKKIRSMSGELKSLQSAQANHLKVFGAEDVATGEKILQLQKEINAASERRTAINAAQSTKSAASDKASAARDRFGKGLAVAGIAAAPIIAATKAAMDFESVMADVRKVVDFDTPQQFKEMSADVLKLSQTLPMSAEGIAQIVAAGGQSGIARDELLAFAESAAKMGIAFDITADQAGDMMAKWRTAFHMGQTDVIELADKINYLGNTTAASAPLISDVVTRIGPLGEIGGVASGEIAALGASMVGTGVQSEIAATGIKNLILGMTAGEGATKSQAAAFAQLGMNTAEVAKKMQVDAKGAILDVMEALQALPKEEQATVLSDLFGKESIGAIAPLLSNLDALKDNFNKVADATQYAGSMQAEYDARAATTENSLQLAKNTLAAVAINIGSALLPAVNNLLTSVAPVIASFAEWAGQNSELVTELTAAAGAAAAVVLAVLGFNAIIATVGAFIANLKLLNTTFQIVTKAQALLNAVMTANPLIFIATAVIALVAALVYLWNTNEGFREAILGAWESVKSGISAAIDYVSAGISGLIAWFKALPDAVTLLGMVAGFIVTKVQQIPAFISNVVQTVANLIVTGVTMYIQFLITFWTTVITGFIDMVTFVVGIIPQVWQAIADMVTQAIAFLPQLPAACIAAGSEFVAGASAWASEAYNSIMDWIKQLPSAISDTIGSAWEGIKAKFSGGFSIGVQAAANANGGIYGRGAFLTTFAENSPEAAIPIDGSQRALDLWAQTGSLLGVSPAGGDSNFTFAPQITVQGGSDAAQTVASVLDMKMREFEGMMRRYQSNQRRLAYE